MDIPYTVKARPDTGLFNAKLGIWLFLASEVMLFGGLFSSYILLRVGADPQTWPQGLLNIPVGTFNTAVLITSSVTVVLGWSALQMNNFAAYRKYQFVTIVCAAAFLVIKCGYEYPEKFKHYEVWKTDGTRVTGHIVSADVSNRTVRVEGGVTNVVWESGHLEGSPWLWSTKTLNGENRKVLSLKLHPDSTHYAFPAKDHHAAVKEGNETTHELEFKPADIKRLSAFVPAHSTYFAIYFTLTALHGLHVLGGGLVIAYLWGPGARLWKTDPQRYTNRVEVSGLFWHFVDLVWIFLFPVFYLL
jgi:cytochrome c oxidase subunit 3